jgi:hypothetical protein
VMEIWNVFVYDWKIGKFPKAEKSLVDVMFV